MSDKTRIGGYDASIGKVGYIYPDAEDAQELWDSALYLECDGSCLIYVDNIIDTLESDDEPLSDREKKLLHLCIEAKEQGIEDIVISGKP